MNFPQIIDSYFEWLGHDLDSFSVPDPIPIANSDIFEDDFSVVNRLFFLIPHVSSGSLRLFIFFEDNSFVKDEFGDLFLSSSSFHLLN